MEGNRVGNASRNIFFGMFLKGYQIILPFIMRTAVGFYLGLSYMGLNSLFGSLLWMLSIAELGVGSAMVYSMYKPIIDKDEKTICALLALYRKYYRIIGTVILTVGIIITPFVPSLIKSDVPDDINIYVIYGLNLFCTIMTYWLFAYKNSLLIAHQRNDIGSKVMLVTNTAQYALQFVALAVFRDYYIYLIVAIVTQIATNIVTAILASKLYPNYQPKGELDISVKKSINQRIKDLFTMKLGIVIVSSSDSIVISAFLGLAILGIYGNYYMILTAAMGIVKVVFDSCMSGIGNSILEEDEEKNYIDLKKMTFIIAWLTGYCSVCLLCLIQPFVKIWQGEARLLDLSIVICFVVYFFVDEINQIFITYKDAAGIWHEDRFRPIVTALVNLSLNILTVNFLGLYGVILSTVVSVVFVGMPWILHNLFTTLFKRSMREYVFKLLFYTVVTTFVSAACFLVCNMITDTGILTLLLKGVICTVMSNVMFLLIYFKTKEYEQVKSLVKRIIKRA